MALSFLLEEVDDPDVLILHLWKYSSPLEEEAAHAEAKRRLGTGAYGISFLGAFDELYDTFELSACLDYARTADFAGK